MFTPLLRETLEKQHAIANERFRDGLPSERLRQVWSKWEASHGTVYIFDGGVLPLRLLGSQ